MATSRTGTTEWRRMRARTLRKAQRLGQRNCPWCGTVLDYEISLQPNSAEVDHVTAYSHTGSNGGELAVICRRCNQSKGNRDAPKLSTVMTVKPLKVSRQW